MPGVSWFIPRFVSQHGCWQANHRLRMERRSGNAAGARMASWSVVRPVGRREGL